MKQDTLDEISQKYKLPLLHFNGSPENGISGHNVIVDTKDGLTYFIKNYKKTDAERRDNSESVESFIATNSDIPVVLPLKNVFEKFHIVINNDMYSVFNNIDHKEYKPIDEINKIKLAKNLGEMLGKIHSVSTKHTIPETINPILSWIVEDKEKSILELQTFKLLITKKNKLDVYDEKALSFIELKESLLEESSFIRKEKEPTSICHGDYHKANILFNDNGDIIGVCDWDISGISNPYIEFVRSYNMCVIRKDFLHYQEKIDFSKAFINGYQNSCNFTFDLNELEYAIESWYQTVISSTFPLSDHYYLNHTKTDSFLFSETDKIIFLKNNRISLFEYIKSFIKI